MMKGDKMMKQNILTVKELHLPRDFNTKPKNQSENVLIASGNIHRIQVCQICSECCYTDCSGGV